MDVGILLLRATIGLTLAAHGGRKLFGWFGGPGLEKTAQGLATLGFRPALGHAYLAGLAEGAGGALLALGLFTPLAAAVIAAVMLVAAFAAHVKRGFFITGGGFEYNLVLGIAGLSLAFTGPGRISLDALFGWSVQGVAWGGAALLAALAGGGIPLARRHTETSQAVPTA
jgi:putative oxidoreductase